MRIESDNVEETMLRVGVLVFCTVTFINVQGKAL